MPGGKPIAVVVDPFSSGNMLAPAFREAGLEPVAVLSGGRPHPAYINSYRPADFDTVLPESPGLLSKLAELDPVCVVPGTECGVELADHLAPALTPDLSNVSPLAPARRHKAKMSAAVAAAGLPTIRQICSADPGEVAAWIADSGLTGRDLVLKPPESAATDGVVRIAAGEDWHPAFTKLLGSENKLGLMNDQVLVQEYLTGTEYVVDTFSHDGRHTLVAVCRYEKTAIDGHMAIYSTMEWLDPTAPEVATVFDYTRQVLDALGIRFGAGHSEIMLTDEGPRLIETGARLHGGGNPVFSRLATGDSQVDRLVSYVAKGTVPPLSYTLRQHVMVVFLMSQVSGIVRNIETLDQIKELPSYHLSAITPANGDHVAATHDLFATLALGFVVLADRDADRIKADQEAIRNIEKSLIIEPD